MPIPALDAVWSVGVAARSLLGQAGDAVLPRPTLLWLRERLWPRHVWEGPVRADGQSAACDRG